MLKAIAALTILLVASFASADARAEASELSTKAEAHGIHVATWQADTRVSITKSDAAVLLDVTCPFGIDRGVLRRTEAAWPAGIRLRLTLQGLERLEVVAGRIAIRSWVQRGPDRRIHATVEDGTSMRTLEPDSPYWTSILVVPDERDPDRLARSFEVTLPRRIFAGNPEEITVRWVDFFRQ
ncbi:MAG: hypothetical protein R3D57_03060 [Hyphomicrobiaceae bacterium]